MVAGAIDQVKAPGADGQPPDEGPMAAVSAELAPQLAPLQARYRPVREDIDRDGIDPQDHPGFPQFRSPQAAFVAGAAGGQGGGGGRRRAGHRNRR